MNFYLIDVLILPVVTLLRLLDLEQNTTPAFVWSFTPPVKYVIVKSYLL